MIVNFYIRKGIHLVSGYIFIWITRYDNVAIYFTGGWVFLTLFFDVLRHYTIRWNQLFLRIFGRFLSSDEKKGKITGATTLWTGLFLIYLLFPYHTFRVAAAIMVFSDALAALFGRTFNTYTFKNGKTAGGFFIFFLSSLIILWYANIPLILVILNAIIVSSLELIWHGSWENFAIGFGAAVSLSLI